MSSVSEHEHLDPNDPEYYAPPWLRKKSQSRLSLSQEARSEPVKAAISLTASLDTQLEDAVSDVLWHPLDPEVIHEPAGLARESDRRAALISFAAGVGVSAVVALFFVVMLPASRQSDAASTSSEIIRSMRTALPQSGQGDDGSKPALAEFQAILASAPASQPATHEQSDQLLQQFLQWRQKPGSTETSK
jgi:hypothetical protein